MKDLIEVTKNNTGQSLEDKLKELHDTNNEEIALLLKKIHIYLINPNVPTQEKNNEHH